MKRPRVGVIGVGVVGGTLAQVLEEEDYVVSRYDPRQGYNDAGLLWGCEIIFVCVWTPMNDAGLETEHVTAAVETAIERSAEGNLIAVRSTVPPGFMSELRLAHPDRHFAFIPEFLVEADPYGSMRKADRVVIGCDDLKRATWAEYVMRDLVPGAPVVRLSPEEAVMVKLSSNALLAAKVALSNELYDVCRAYHVDWNQIRGVVGMDRRIGPDHLTVTEERGYGGSCFPKDIRGLIGAGRDAGWTPEIFEKIEEVNDDLRESLQILEEIRNP